jgi:transcriptional regulator with XRE-family HTH domain
MSSAIATNLRVERARARISQAELAAKAGINPVTISNIETGRHSPTLKTLEALANALGVSMSRLLSLDALAA